MLWLVPFWSFMAFCLAALGLLTLFGGRRPRPNLEADKTPDSWPRVSIIIPVAGAVPRLAENFLSLFNQDYPDFEIIFVTRDNTDPASLVIQDLRPRHGRSKQVFAGPAVNRGQKNHNLLAGLAAAATDTEVYVFCDSGHEAPPDWLKNLVTPLLAGNLSVSSGYHQVIPAGQGMPAQGLAIWTLALNLLRTLKPFAQPWGGSTAIARTVFEKLAVADVWARTVVDDVTLAALMRKSGVNLGLPHSACMKTRVENYSWADGVNWLTRQWAYLKFIFPASWALIGLFGTLFTFGLAICSAQFLLFPFGVVSIRTGLMGGLCLSLYLLMAAAMRRLHPCPGPLRRWLAASLFVLGAAGISHARTWLSRWILWNGIRYKVGRNGIVLEIKHPPVEAEPRE